MSGSLSRSHQTEWCRGVKLEAQIQMSIKKDVFNIWDEAVDSKNKEQMTLPTQKILIILGGSSSGKTSFLKVIRNEAEAEVKSTYLMEYSFLRRGHLRKEITHCYQIASRSQSDIIPALFGKENFTKTTVAICADLSRPESIVGEVREWLQVVREEVGRAVQERLGLEEQERQQEWARGVTERLLQTEDFKRVQAAPCNLVLVGCKYDLFEKYETESRKWLSKTMRWLAHEQNMHLVYCSTRQALLGQQTRAALHDLMFQDSPGFHPQKDHLRPVFVPRGQDSFAGIEVVAQGLKQGMEVLNIKIGTLFEAHEEKKKEGTDMSKYQEEQIENLLEQRKKELIKLSKINKVSKFKSKATRAGA